MPKAERSSAQFRLSMSGLEFFLSLRHDGLGALPLNLAGEGARATPANIKGLCVTFNYGNPCSTLLPLRLTLSTQSS